jgi:hypothetical protein
MSTLMDYLKTLIRLFFILFVVNSISGCDTEVSPEPLQIKGVPPDFLYYDGKFEYKFGASGGDGVYRYRYIQHPDISDNEELKENPVKMNIEVVDGAEPGFILRATPEIPEDFDQLNDQKFRYQIELTDGRNTTVETYDFTLKKNNLKFSTSTTLIKEGTTNNRPAKNLQDQLKFEESRTRICSEVSEKSYEKRLTEKGYVYPHVFQVSVDTQVASRTKLYYRLKSNYSDSDPERSKRNIGFAREDVDYLDEVRSIVLEPGVITCVVYIDLLDDFIVEDKESVSIEFFSHEGGAVEYKSTRLNLEITDDEIEPQYRTQQIVRNVGDKVIVPISLSRPVDYPVTVNISVDSDKTTALDSDFRLEPASGVITIAPGEIEASYSVSLLDNSVQASSSYVDKIITLTTDIDEILEVKPYTIEINEWASGSNIDSEIVGRSSHNEKVIDFTSDDDGIVTTLIESNSSPNKTAILRSYNRDSTPASFLSSQQQLELSKVGMDVIPRALVNDSNNLVVVLNVEGLFADIFRGGSDFVVIYYKKERDSQFSFVSSRQYGTEGDDTVSGAKLKNGVLYVYGKTNGKDFEGLPSFESNNGGEDGFLYSIELANNSHKWSRFIGTSDQDELVGIDIGNREVIAIGSSKNTDEDAFIRKLSSVTGLDLVGEDSIVIRTRRDDKPVAVRFDATASNYRALLDSDAKLDSQDLLTPSLSRDIQLIPYTSEDEFTSALSFATEQDDIAKYLENMPNNLHLLVAGDTYGEFDGNVKRGETGTDAFVSILGTENSSDLADVADLQFGTPADDQIISVKPISNTKFFVLWSEKFTESDDIVYRISAFSIDGKKLSRDPQ